MALALVQQAVNQGGTNSTTQTVTFSANTTTNNLVCLGFACINTITVSSISGAATGWTLAIQNIFSVRNVEIWYGLGNATATATVTMSSKNNSTRNLQVAEFSGNPTSSLLGNTGNGDNSANTIDSGSVTPGATDSLCFVHTSTNSTAVTNITSGPTNSFTEFTRFATSPISVSAYKLNVGTSAIDCQWTFSGATQVTAGAIAEFKALAVDVPTLGWRGSRPDTVSHQAGQPRRGGGMSPPCHKAPDTLTGQTPRAA